ncbi:hypothetical protein BV898_18608 [Hypsibius exemplaris]|uniref:Receptor ligand binding region domain-containing protein n=1 Tax=Hypsibius exemplaris TaxID=2072580 RepID=A0A9X6NJZ8_HYPEX|nr:hypothetical protein BV898_18608 [Hypsibius exemplaris]
MIATRGVLPQKTKIEVLVTLQYEMPGYVTNAVFMSPTFEVARDEVMKRHRGQYNVSVRYFQHKDHHTCDDINGDAVADVSEYLFRHRREDTCYAIVETGCNDQNGLSSLADALDILVFTLNMDAMKKNYLNPKSAPATTVSIGASSVSFCMALVELLDQHKWYHPTVIIETTITVSRFYQLSWKFLLEVTKQSGSNFQMVPLNVDNIISNSDLMNILMESKLRSRVYVLLSTATLALRILALTDELGMSNGEYAFINVQPIRTSAYGVPVQFVRAANNHLNLNASRSLIFLAPQPHPSTSITLAYLNAKIANLTLAQYNYSYNGVPPLDSGNAARIAFEIVEIFSTLVIERDNTLRGSGQCGPCSGNQLVDRIANRTFAISSGRVYFTAGGIRLINTEMFAFNTSTLSLQTIGVFDGTKQRFTLYENKSIPWPTSNGSPPADVPECGFTGHEGRCAAERISTIITALSTASGCVVLLVGSAFYRWLRQQIFESANYWVLQRRDLHLPGYPGQSRLSMLFSCVSLKAAQSS